MHLFSKKEKKPRKLTPREAKFFDILAKDPTISIRDAGREAGYSEATVVSGKLCRVSKGFDSPLQKALQKSGLTETEIAKKISEGTNAFKTTRFNAHKGDTHEYIKEHDVDFDKRFKYLELTCRIRGDLTPQDDQPNKTSISINSVVINNDIDINQAVKIYQDTINNLEED